MSQTINIKDIPGYCLISDLPCLIQCTYHFSWGAEIDFHSRTIEQVKANNSEALIAVWHLKQLH